MTELSRELRHYVDRVNVDPGQAAGRGRPPARLHRSGAEVWRLDRGGGRLSWRTSVARLEQSRAGRRRPVPAGGRARDRQARGGSGTGGGAHRGAPQGGAGAGAGSGAAAGRPGDGLGHHDGGPGDPRRSGRACGRAARIRWSSCWPPTPASLRAAWPAPLRAGSSPGCCWASSALWRGPEETRRWCSTRSTRASAGGRPWPWRRSCASWPARSQVVVVTHLAHVAALASRHYVIEKSSDGGGAVTRSGAPRGPGRRRRTLPHDGRKS